MTQTTLPASDTAAPPVLAPTEGWHVLHLFYTVNHSQWEVLSPDEQIQAKTRLSRLVQEIRATPQTQLLAFSVLTPKADLAFMILTPDLQTANAFEKRLTLSLGADILTPTYSYLSMTEWTEYVTSDGLALCGLEVLACGHAVYGNRVLLRRGELHARGCGLAATDGGDIVLSFSHNED